DRTMAVLADREPLVTAADLDEDVGELTYSLEQYYHPAAGVLSDLPPGLDGALRSIVADLGRPGGAASEASRKPAATLIRRLERDLMADVYRWTGHFPERTRVLLRHLAERAASLELVYAEE